MCSSIAVKCYYHLDILLLLSRLGKENEKYLIRAIASIVPHLLTGENIFINLHCGRWRKIQLQLKLNKTRSPKRAYRKRRRLGERLAALA